MPNSNSMQKRGEGRSRKGYSQIMAKTAMNHALAYESSETDFHSQKVIATENEKARNSLS